jgi:hypothetical protein
MLVTTLSTQFIDFGNYPFWLVIHRKPPREKQPGFKYFGPPPAPSTHDVHTATAVVVVVIIIVNTITNPIELVTRKSITFTCDK